MPFEQVLIGNLSLQSKQIVAKKQHGNNDWSKDESGCLLLTLEGSTPVELSFKLAFTTIILPARLSLSLD